MGDQGATGVSRGSLWGSPGLVSELAQGQALWGQEHSSPLFWGSWNFQDIHRLAREGYRGFPRTPAGSPAAAALCAARVGSRWAAARGPSGDPGCLL